MKGYTNKTEVENYLLINIDSSFDAQFERWVAQVETYIDRQTGRNFIADDTASDRVFDGDGSSKLLIDDLVELTKLLPGVGADDVLADSDYGDNVKLYPANALVQSPPVPYTRLQLVGSIFPKGLQNITVGGKWGFSVEVPDDIKFAATVLVAGIVNFSNDSEGEVQSMTIGRYSVTYRSEKEWQDFKQIKGVLASYKKFGAF